MTQKQGNEDDVVVGEFGAAYWEDRYRKGGASRREPSPSLLAEAAGLPPGTALDAGCGWGADAMWLAARGWTVTAVDVSPAAVNQARQYAEDADPHAAARVTFLPADLTTWHPDDRYDLVTSHYVHVPGPQEALFARLASWVVPGGTLLIVGHGYTPGRHGHGHHDARHGVGEGEQPGSPPDSARVRIAQITSALTQPEWEIVAAEPRTHSISRPGGGPPAVLDDVLVRARRL
jgi:SAM-dependent methyltransferase